MEWPKISTAKYLLQAFVVSLALAIVIFPDGESPVWVTGLVRGVFGVLVYAWIRRDSEHFRFSLSQNFASFSAILPEIGVPIYLFRTRKIKGALLALMRIAIFVMLAAILAVSVGVFMKRSSMPQSAMEQVAPNRPSFQG